MSSELILGVDEAGRGPWAGSVFAAAVVLDVKKPILGLADSKKLSAIKRSHLAIMIQGNALAWGIGAASAQEIDEVNVLQATFLAMRRAVAQIPEGLSLLCHAWVDGNRDPILHMPTTTLIKGDDKIQAISAASILAKVARDEEAFGMHLKYPEYGFDRHKGYGTALHSAMLHALGPTPEHRKSFAPVAKWYMAQAAAL